MKKILIILIISSLTLFASVGKITALKGEVYIERNGALNFAKVGAKLELKDKVVTKERSKALLLFNDQTSITVGKNASMAVEKFVFDTNVASNNQANFKFGQGVFRTITGKIGKLNKSKFQIKTSTASIGIRGTVFDVSVSNDVTKVGVVEGGIFYVDTATMKSFDVQQGEKLVYDDTTGGVSVEPGALEETKEMDQESKELKEEVSKEEKESDENGKKKDDKVKKEKKKDDKNDVAEKKEKKEDKSNDEKNNQQKESEKTISDKKDDEKEELKNNQEKEQSKENISNSDENKNETQQDSTIDNTEKQNNEVVQTEEKSQPTEPKKPIETEQNNEIIQTEQTQTIENNPEPIATPTNIPEKTPVEGFDDIDTGSLETDIETTTIAIDAPKNTQQETETNTQTQTVETQDVEQPVVQTPDTQDIPNVFDITNVVDEVSETTQETASQQEEKINIAPVINGPNLINLDEDTYTSFNILASDEDNIKLTYSIASEPTNGKAIINESTGEIIYTPNPNYSGIENIKISVSDGSSIITSDITIIVKDIVEPINPSTPSNSLPDISTDIEAITNKIMDENSDRYMEFGFIGVDSDNDYLPDDPSNTELYLTGDITPSEVIENYISTSQTASYSGGVSAIVNGVTSNGTVNFDVNFGTQNFTGNINITQGNWTAFINSGGVTPYGFNSTDISGSSDYGSIIDGAVDGNFYGPSANSVGGNFNLSTPTKSANGVFGGSK